ncbi:hypothetical protein B9Z55_026280 [Caenorhabditis nigoni]|uniref:Uncharacterized protein n=1 Tax=Caenorhabditis nigoni TaxID=1611254 RepID=A0A2G5T2Y7_9PELO|nr:hypothetical protein B9Z55_026280 [Caenorhabditis nigoni]
MILHPTHDYDDDDNLSSTMNFSLFILFIATVFLTGQAAIFSSYPAYQNSNWHYDNYGNLMIGNRDNGFYMGPCFGPECPWGK